jgi:hypothetical protein
MACLLQLAFAISHRRMYITEWRYEANDIASIYMEHVERRCLILVAYEIDVPHVNAVSLVTVRL